MIRPVAESSPRYRAFDDDHIGGEPLGEFHTVEEEEASNTGRIVGGLAVALMLGAAAIYGYEVSNRSRPSLSRRRPQPIRRRRLPRRPRLPRCRARPAMHDSAVG